MPSSILMRGAEFCLVAVVHSIPNNFVTQLRSGGRWLKHDFILGASTTFSDDFDSDWYRSWSLAYMYVYLRKSMTLPVVQPQTTAYRSAGHHERVNNERLEIIEATRPEPARRPPYRSPGHHDVSSAAVPYWFDFDVPPP